MPNQTMYAPIRHLMSCQAAWKQLQANTDHGNNNSSMDGTLVLKVIASAAQRFPAAEASQLAADLLKVRQCCDAASSLSSLPM